jgi:ribonuclease BN (tRNA processing enzyme)
MDHPSFPVHLTEMGAKMAFYDLAEGQVVELDTGDGSKVSIRNARGNHPNGVFAYRVDHAGRSCVYITDTEHYSVIDPKLAKLAKGADVLIYDSQFTPEEYAGTAGTGGPKLGWGHSTYDEAAKLAKAAGVKELFLFHHDPTHTDAQVRDKERLTRALFENTRAAREGLTVEI